MQLNTPKSFGHTAGTNSGLVCGVSGTLARIVRSALFDNGDSTIEDFAFSGRRRVFLF